VKLRFLLCLALAAAFTAAPADAQATKPSSRYTKLDDCKEIGRGDIDQGEDWLVYKCVGLEDLPVWLAYTDSARSQFGFGPQPNTHGIFGLDRNDDWQVEWRGVEKGGKFVPFAVIVRAMRPMADAPSDGKGFLFVYRLTADGMSCIEASDLSSNEEARAIADGTRENFECDDKPRELDFY
jgi:hypothetical protein